MSFFHALSENHAIKKQDRVGMEIPAMLNIWRSAMLFAFLSNSLAPYLSCDNWSPRRSTQGKSLWERWEPWSLWLTNEWVAQCFIGSQAGIRFHCLGLKMLPPWISPQLLFTLSAEPSPCVIRTSSNSHSWKWGWRVLWRCSEKMSLLNVKCTKKNGQRALSVPLVPDRCNDFMPTC